MKKVFAFILVVTLATVGFPAFADNANYANAAPDPAAAREDNRKIQQALPLAAEWLLEHPDPRKRAAGLLYRVSAIEAIVAQAASLASLTADDRFRDYPSIRQAALDALERAEARDDDLPKFEPAELLDRFEQAIRTTTDGAALAWLAAACATADIEAFCIDAGIDDAIVRHDGANLFSRVALLSAPTSERIEALILDAHQTRTFENVLLNTWFDALDTVDSATQLKDHDRLLGAYSVVLAYAIPAYQPFAKACGAAVTPGSELELACDRFLDDMAEQGETAMTQMMPSSIHAKRASARGLDQRAAEFEAEKQRIHQSASCAGSEIDRLLKAGNGSTVRQYLDLLLEHGEIEGMGRFVEAHGIDCSVPADPAAAK